MTAPNLTPVLIDTVGLSDSVVSVATAAQTATDPVGLTDSITVSLSVTLPADSVGITDASSYVNGALQTFTDPVGISDTQGVSRTVVLSVTTTMATGSTVVHSRPGPPPAVEVIAHPRPSITVPYELVCVARIPQASGAPLLLEVDPIEWTGLSFTEELSKPETLDAGCLIGNLTEAVVQRLRNGSQLPSELWLYRAGKLVFAGPLVGGLVQGESLSLRAVGLLGYTRLMFVNTADLTFKQVDQLLIAKALVDHWQNSPYGHFGIDTSSISPSGILRDATYLAKENHPIGQRIEEMGARNNGFDVGVDPSSRKLELLYPMAGIDRSSGEDAIVFDQRNVTSPNIAFSFAAGDVASVAFGTATNTEGISLYAVKTNAQLLATYGRAGIAGTFDGVSQQATLDGHVQGLLDARGEALLVPGPDVRVTPDSDLLAYGVGDTVRYQLHTRLSVEGNFRLRKRRVVVSKTGQERVSVEFV